MILFLFVFLLGFININARCAINILNDDEQACANKLNLDGNSVVELYQTNSDSQVFFEYLACTWPKLHFVTNDGVILYKNIIRSKSLPWIISRICEDVVQLIRQTQLDFEKSALYCEKNPPAVANPFTVRKCIAENYKPTPIEDILKQS